MWLNLSIVVLVRFSRGLLAAVLLAFLGGCASMEYYLQSIQGQWDLMNRRQSVEQILNDPGTDAQLRRQLEYSQQARNFASEWLGLPENDSYRSYADLKRPAAIWNVVATPEFSLQPKTWCFLVVGCLSYRGYFSKQQAQQFAEQLRQQGLDVIVTDVPAYSTLGWFDDPLLNTMMHWSDTRLAGLIFHELAHQVLYIKDDTTFNESFAVAVELEGTRRWLTHLDQDRQWNDYQLNQQRKAAFVAMLLETRDRLQGLYHEPLEEQPMRLRKQQLIDRMRQDYARLRAQWGHYSGYDAWMEREINNARFALLATYRDYVPAFQALLAQQEGDLVRFYQAATTLSKMPESKRRQRIDQLLSQAR